MSSGNRLADWIGIGIIVSFVAAFVFLEVTAFKYQRELDAWTASCYAAKGYVVDEGHSTLCEDANRKILGEW